MSQRKLPLVGSEESKEWCGIWDTSNKSGKVALCQKWDVGYEKGKNYRSQCRKRSHKPSEVHVVSHHIETKKRLKTAPDRMQTVAVVGDDHNPYHDRKTVAAVNVFLGELQPEYLVKNGDVTDFYQISKFDKSPERIDKLQDDIDSTTAMLHTQRDLLPNAVIILIEGNHEDRWRRFLWSKAVEIASLRCLQLEKLLRLDEYEISHVSYEDGLMINDIFLVIHGDISSVHSGYTAKRMFEKHGGCGVTNHCHKGGSFYKRDRFGIWGWWENFCLCNLNPDWIKNPNWMQGLSLVHFKGKRFWVEQIPIIDHAFMYGGKLYGE